MSSKSINKGSRGETVLTTMKPDKPQHKGELDLNTWEHQYHDDLSVTYKSFFAGNEKIECTYTDFVIYCYNHSSKTANRFN